mmetsp:Transcript_8599/g.14832  ORF Transcript_8599/g.14832 Transcript_8599/m.14832 type:complete len:203 (+) Transcript_8599:301-909(+)
MHIISHVHTFMSACTLAMTMSNKVWLYPLTIWSTSAFSVRSSCSSCFRIFSRSSSCTLHRSKKALYSLCSSGVHVSVGSSIHGSRSRSSIRLRFFFSKVPPIICLSARTLAATSSLLTRAASTEASLSASAFKVRSSWVSQRSTWMSSSLTTSTSSAFSLACDRKCVSTLLDFSSKWISCRRSRRSDTLSMSSSLRASTFWT